MTKNYFIYLVIFLEGFVVLATELLAIRLTIPFVGSGTDTISVVIAGVLMPLAAGYYRGGSLSISHPRTIRTKLKKNFLLSLIILSAGLSYALVSPFFEHLIETLNQKNRLILAALYVFLFIAPPTYFLGQTIPLISRYFKKETLTRITGKILFFSTFGSFLGATFTTIVLMNLVGVPYTSVCVLLTTALLITLLSKSYRDTYLILAFIPLIFGIFINSPTILKQYDVVTSNAYNIVQIKEHEGKKPIRYLKLDGSFSASIFRNDDDFPMLYAKYIDENLIHPMQRLGDDGKILILGAGGFTLGRNNLRNDILYVDIDPQLKKVAEDHFLQKPIDKNKTFIAQPARSFLSETEDLFDLIVIDLGKGITGIPEHLVTTGFFQQIKDRLKPNGIAAAHYTLSPLIDDPFSRGLDNTINSVFPYTSRIILGGYNPYATSYIPRNSVIYIYKNNDGETSEIYTDLLNRSAIRKNLRLQ